MILFYIIKRNSSVNAIQFRNAFSIETKKKYLKEQVISIQTAIFDEILKDIIIGHKSWQKCRRTHKRIEEFITVDAYAL